MGLDGEPDGEYAEVDSLGLGLGEDSSCGTGETWTGFGFGGFGGGGTGWCNAKKTMPINKTAAPAKTGQGKVRRIDGTLSFSVAGDS
jgi:hypothetical protein